MVKHNPFEVWKVIEGITGKSVKVTRMKKSGLLLVEVDCQQYAVSLLNTTQLHDIPVQITEHKTLNSSKGVATSDALDDLSNDEIKDKLNESGQDVKEVFRIMTTKDKEKKTYSNSDHYFQ